MPKKIKTSYTFDSISGLRVGTVSLGDKKIETPIKALELSKFKPNLSLNKKIKGVNEIYKSFPSETRYTKSRDIWRWSINDYRKDGSKNTNLTHNLEQMSNKVDKDKELTICFTEFDGDRYPNKDELRFLATRSFCYSDIVPFPILSQITKFVNINNYPEYLTFLKTMAEEYQKLNDHPLMGIIPIKLGNIIVNDIVDFLIDNDITAFCVDFGGCTITSKYPDIVDFYKKLDDYGLIEGSFLYSINTSAGRASHEKPVISAKNILSFGYGFDVLGRSQPPPIPAKKTISTDERRFRIFNKKNYGYYRVIGSDIKEVFPNDSSIPLEILTNIKVKVRKGGETYLDNSIPNLFNIEQQGIEALNLRQIIKEEEAQKYIEQKKYIDRKDKAQILTMQKNIKAKQKNIDDW